MYQASSKPISSTGKRRAYTRTNQVQRSSPSYVRFRSRNNEAVKRFRQKSKNQVQDLEEDISRYQHLTEIFEQERCRLEKARETLENLVQLHVRGEHITEVAYNVIDNIGKERQLFREEVLSQLSDDEEFKTQA